MKKKSIYSYYVLFVIISLMNVAKAQGQRTQSDSAPAQSSAAKEEPKKTDSLINVAFGTVKKQDLINAVSSVNVAELIKKDYATNSLDGLQSFIGGYTGNVWGQQPLILVDGIPRRASDVRFTEVESVTVLKDASAVALYGSRAAKGVVLITTKRGQIKPLTIDVRANTGWYVPKAYPNYLNAADYMTLYNEASRNDGVTEKYSQSLIDNTRAGTNPYRYPDVNYFGSDYLKKAYNKTDITGEISGGNDRARYYTNFGLSYNSSIVKYGDQKNNNDLAFNVRANVDMNLTKWLTASTDVSAIVADNYTGRGDFWGTSATLRPNWFSPLVPISMFDPNNASLQTIANTSNNIINGNYLLGGTSTDQTNAFADMLAAGYIKNKNRTFMFNIGANADLSGILKGLSFKTVYSVDYTDLYSEAYKVGYAVYQPTWTTVNGADVITGLTKFGNDSNSTNETVGSSSYTQTMSLRSQFNYNRTFGTSHNVSATLLGWGYQTQISNDADHSGSTYHPDDNLNLGFQANYNFRHSYYVDFTGNIVHSTKLPDQRRNALSPTVTLGWRVSNEKFFKDNVSFVDDLKLTASYANLNQDIDITDYYLYSLYYDNKAGWYQWRDGAAGGWTTGSKRGANPNLTFIKRQEFRAGLDALLLNKSLSVNANYFIQNTNGLLSQGASSIYPSYFSNYDYSFLPYVNYNNDRRSGVDFAVNYNKRAGDFAYSVGVSGMFLSTKALRRDELYLDSYQNRAGQSLDASWGYISQGFFTDQNDINTHAKQSFGEVKPGDIKYQDVNNDGVIDTRDQVNLGSSGASAPPFTFGINVTLKYKNFTFFALGRGNTGAVAFKNSSYYWVKGASKYSDVVLGRWTPETQNTATYPRLTTTDNSNNFQNSTFWMYKTNRFDLTRVQLTYDFKGKFLQKSAIHALSVYINGDNLLTISGNRKLMETNIGAAPQYRFYNLGVKAAF